MIKRRRSASTSVCLTSLTLCDHHLFMIVLPQAGLGEYASRSKSDLLLDARCL